MEGSKGPLGSPGAPILGGLGCDFEGLRVSSCVALLCLVWSYFFLSGQYFFSLVSSCRLLSCHLCPHVRHALYIVKYDMKRMSHFSLVLSGPVASCLVSSRVEVSFLVWPGLFRPCIWQTSHIKIAWSGQVWSGLVKVWSRPRPKRPPGGESGTEWQPSGGEGMTRHIRMGPPHRVGSDPCWQAKLPRSPFSKIFGQLDAQKSRCQ